MSDHKKSFDFLEKKIQKLISSHHQLKAENQTLLETNKRLEDAFQAERGKLNRIEEGYEHLRDAEKKKTKHRVVLLKEKINELVSEVDRSVALINGSHKK